MKMIEIQVLEEYEVSLDRYSRDCILIISKDMPVPEVHKTGRIRQIAGAKHRRGRPEKPVKLDSPVWNYRTQRYENVRWVPDHDAEETDIWDPVWVPINRISRLWSEYEEEKEIQEEIRRAREEEQKSAREQEAQRYQKVKAYLDEMIPEHGLRVAVDDLSSGYGYHKRNTISGADRIEFWERFIEQLSKRL